MITLNRSAATHTHACVRTVTPVQTRLAAREVAPGDQRDESVVSLGKFNAVSAASATRCNAEARLPLVLVAVRP